MAIESSSPHHWGEEGSTQQTGLPENGDEGLQNHAQNDSVMQTRVANLLDDITEMNDGAMNRNEMGASEPEVGQGASPALPPAEGTDSHADLRIRGRNDGLSVEIGSGEWQELLTQLDERLEQSASFFRDGNVALIVGRRHLDEAELFELRELLERFSLTLGVVRTSSERTFDAALAVGLAATLEGEGIEESVVAHPAESNDDLRAHFVYRGNLRSGQLLHRHESVLVIGDVNPGANVISDGDIMIWGRLRGVAHAGAAGDERAIIGALTFEPIQLRIGGLIAIAPEKSDAKRSGRDEAYATARIAYVTGEQIVVADWPEARRDGKSVLRR
jgi:septum site-determining protein MinC